MRQLRSFPLLAAFLFSLASATVSASEPVVIGRTEHLHSAVLDEDRTYHVALPASYRWATDRRYPVLYVLDGAWHFQHAAASAGYLAEHGEIPEMIVVAIDSTKRVRDFTQSDWPTAWIGGGGAANFKRFLSTELIPAVERSYRTDGFRALSGHSASGQFVLYCLAAEPALFRGSIALSPSLDWDGNLPQRSLEAAFEATPELANFLYVARSDDAGRALADYERLVETLAKKSPRGFRWHSQAFPDETHVSLPLLAGIDGLRHLYSGYRLHDDLLEKGFAFAEEHFRQVSKTVGWTLPVPESAVNDLAYAALEQGRTVEALALFQRNVEANPNSAAASDGLADGYAKAERWAEAAEAAARAERLALAQEHPDRAYFAEQARKLAERAKAAAMPD
jgi:predicted alpha/beta superfamily hydrolase